MASQHFYCDFTHRKRGHLNSKKGDALSGEKSLTIP